MVRRIALVVILGAIMSLLDSTIVNVALRTLSTQLHCGIATSQWVVTGYLLSVAAVIPVTGWAARRFGARRVYLAAVALFTIGSVACGLAQSIQGLIAMRVVQGIGGGMILPVGQMIMVRAAGPAAMPRVMSLIGVPIVLAPVFGPTIGGLVIDNLGWRYIFFVNLPIGLLALAAGRSRLPADEPSSTHPLDWPGLVAVTGGMVLATYGLAQVGTRGRLDDPVAATCLAAGLILLTAFVARSLRVAAPLLDLRLMRQPVFAAASLTTFCLGGAMYGGMVLMPLYFQTVRGDSALLTGLLIAPSGLGAAAGNWLSGRLVVRWGGGMTAMAGGVIGVASTLPLVLLTGTTAYGWLAASFVLRGLGFGLALMPAMTSAYRHLDRAKINDATPQLSVLRQLGGSVGTALFVVVLVRHLAHPGDPGRAFGTTFGWVAVVAALATVPTLLLAARERRMDTGEYVGPSSSSPARSRRGRHRRPRRPRRGDVLVPAADAR